MVDEGYDLFVRAVARGRGVEASVARGEDFGEGHTFPAREALRRGLVDTVGTFEETLARLGAGPAPASASEGGRASAGDLEVRTRRLRQPIQQATPVGMLVEHGSELTPRDTNET